MIETAAKTEATIEVAIGIETTDEMITDGMTVGIAIETGGAAVTEIDGDIVLLPATRMIGIGRGAAAPIEVEADESTTNQLPPSLKLHPNLVACKSNLKRILTSAVIVIRRN